MASSASAEGRGALLGAKLRGLVGDHLDRPLDAVVASHPAGAALVVGESAWVLVDDPAGRHLGGALAWALRAGATSLHLVAGSDTGLLARRAEQFTYPISVWIAQDRTLRRAAAESLAAPVQASPAHLDMGLLIEEGGATVNVEHGVVFGEVRGLEVCRVVSEPTVGHIAELNDVEMPPGSVEAADGVILEVGVGANDREAFRLIHGDLPAVDALRGVVDAVRRHRVASADQHPLNRMAQERFLRWRLEDDPSLVGLVEVRSTQPPVPRPGLRESAPCTAIGHDTGGGRADVVCTVGVDLNLVSYVADVQRITDNDVLVVMPPRDRVPITEDLLGLLTQPVRVHTVD